MYGPWRIHMCPHKDKDSGKDKVYLGIKILGYGSEAPKFQQTEPN